MAKLLITDAVVGQMLSKPRIKAAFPFLRNPPKSSSRKKGGCSGCGGSKSRGASVNVNAVKRWAANLGPKKREQLKELLRVDAIKVRFTHKGQQQTVEY